LRDRIEHGFEQTANRAKLSRRKLVEIGVRLLPFMHNIKGHLVRTLCRAKIVRFRKIRRFFAFPGFVS
jgi:hypothetical protein